MIIVALKGKTQTVKEQVFLKCCVAEVQFHCVFVVVPDLTRNIILGYDWLSDKGVRICFESSTIRGCFDGVGCEILFKGGSEKSESIQVCEIGDKEFFKAGQERRTQEEEIHRVVTEAEEFDDNEKERLKKLILEYREVFNYKPGTVNCYMSMGLLLRIEVRFISDHTQYRWYTRKFWCSNLRG